MAPLLHPGEGNYCDWVIDDWLEQNVAPLVHFRKTASDVPRGSKAEAFLHNLPPNTDRFLLRWHQGVAPYQCRNYGHAVCIRKHPANGTWWLLDSEKGRAEKLSDQQWRRLKGSVYILAPGYALGRAYSTYFTGRPEVPTVTADTEQGLPHVPVDALQRRQELGPHSPPRGPTPTPPAPHNLTTTRPRNRQLHPRPGHGQNAS